MLNILQWARDNTNSLGEMDSLLRTLRQNNIDWARNSNAAAAERYIECLSGNYGDYGIPQSVIPVIQHIGKQIREYVPEVLVDLHNRGKINLGMFGSNGSSYSDSDFITAWGLIGSMSWHADAGENGLDTLLSMPINRLKFIIGFEMFAVNISTLGAQPITQLLADLDRILNQLLSDMEYLFNFTAQKIGNGIEYTRMNFLDLFMSKYNGAGSERYYHRDRIDPLILDLNGNGKIDVTGTEGGAHFDYNGDDMINNGSELFGDDFILGLKEGYEGTEHNPLISNREKYQYAQNGFEALAILDSNGDGIINQQDADYHQIKVWVDKNGDDQGSADGSSAEFSR